MKDNKYKTSLIKFFKRFIPDTTKEKLIVVSVLLLIEGIITACIILCVNDTTKNDQNSGKSIISIIKDTGKVADSQNTSDSTSTTSTTITYDPTIKTTTSSTAFGQTTTTTLKYSQTTTTTTITNIPTTTTTTLPESPSAVVVFYADSQSDTDAEDVNHQRVVNYILSSGANPVFHAGDLMEDGTQASLDRFNTVTATLRSSRIFYAALGNNDRKEGDPSTPSQLFLDNFTFPNNERWYSVNYGNLHVVVLDSAFASGSGSQLSWLASDLASSASQSRITCVMYHHPTFSSTISSYLVNNGVDFVITGHNHSYSHTISNGINYYVLSGQPSIGYIKASVYSNKVIIRAYNSGNGLIETNEFNEK